MVQLRLSCMLAYLKLGIPESRHICFGSYYGHKIPMFNFSMGIRCWCVHGELCVAPRVTRTLAMLMLHIVIILISLGCSAVGEGQFTVYGSSMRFCHGIVCNMQKPQCYWLLQLYSYGVTSDILFWFCRWMVLLMEVSHQSMSVRAMQNIDVISTLTRYSQRQRVVRKWDRRLYSQHRAGSISNVNLLDIG